MNRALVLWLVGVALVSLLAFDLRPTLEMRGFVPDGFEAATRIDPELGAAFADADRLLVVVERAVPMSPEEAAPIVERVAQALAEIRDIESVEQRLSPELRSYWSQLAPRRALARLSTESLAELAGRLTDDSIRERIGRLKEARFADPLRLQSALAPLLSRVGTRVQLRYADGLLSDRKGNRYFILLTTGFPRGNVEASRGLVAAIDDRLEALHLELASDDDAGAPTLSALGWAQVSTEIHAEWSLDARTCIQTTLIVIYLCFATFFGRPWAALLALVPVALSLAGTLLIGQWLFGDVHLITLVVSSLLVGLGIDYAFHLGSHFWLSSEAGSSMPVEERVRRAMRRPARAIVLGGVTTAAALFTLGGSQFPAIREIGAILGIGILLLLVSSFSFFPALFRASAESPTRTSSPGIWNRFTRVVSDTLTGTGRRRAITLGWVALVAFAAFGATRIEMNGSPYPFLFANNDTYHAYRELIDEIGVAFHPIVAVSSGATAEEAIERDRTFVEALMSQPRRSGIAIVESLSTYIPERGRFEAAKDYLQRHPGAFDRSRILHTFDQAVDSVGAAAPERIRGKYARRLDRVLDVDLTVVDVDSLRRDGLGPEVDRHLRQIGNRYHAASYFYPREDPWKGNTLRLIEQQATRVGATDASAPILLSEVIDPATREKAITEDFLRIMTAAAVIVLLLLVGGLRRVSVALRAFVPVGVGALLLAGFMGAANIPLHIFNMAALPLVFGIGVDDGLHLAERLRRQVPIEQVFREVLPGIVMTSITTAASFGSMCLADSPAIRDFGICGAVGTLLCLTTSLFLMPLLWREGAESGSPVET